jgi:hypothetical protein
MTYVDLKDEEQRCVEVFVADRWLLGWLVASLDVDDVLSWKRVAYCSDTPGNFAGWFEDSYVRAPR